MVRVYHWQLKLESDGPKAAFEKVAEELRKEGKFVPWTTIRSACKRANERFVLRFPDVFYKHSELDIFNSKNCLHLPSTYRLPTFCEESPTPIAFQT